MDSFDKARWNTGVDLSGDDRLDATRFSIACMMSLKDAEVIEISELQSHAGSLFVSNGSTDITWDNRATITPDSPPEVECRYCASPVPLTRTHCGACGAPRKVKA